MTTAAACSLGDIVHIDALQLAEPDVGLRYDVDPAAHTRHTTLEKAAREGWYVAGSHVTGIHHTERDGDGFAFAQETACEVHKAVRTL